MLPQQLGFPRETQSTFQCPADLLGDLGVERFSGLLVQTLPFRGPCCSLPRGA